MNSPKLNAMAGFYFTLERVNNGFSDETALRFSGGKGGLPDYRRYTGSEREALREFLAEHGRQARGFYVDFDGAKDGKKPGDLIFNPENRLIERLLAAGLLRNAGAEPLSAADGFFRCALKLEDSGDSSVMAALVLEDGAGGILEGGGKTAFAVYGASIAVAGKTVYRVEDLGPRWNETAFLNTVIPRTEMSAFLSLVFSRFTGMPLIYGGWTVRKARPVQALPALLFMEIDRYGYLHIRPIAYLQNFPPLFLENEEIVSAVNMDEAGKTIGISEIVFPEDSGDILRSMLFKRDKTAKSMLHEENGRFILAPDFAKTFFAENIIELTRRFVLLQTAVLKDYRLNFSRPKVRLSMGRGIDYLSGSCEIELEGETFSFQDFMREYRESSFITLADGSRTFPDKRTMDKLDRLVSALDGGAVQLSYFDIPLLLQDDNFEVEGAAWEDARPFFANYNGIASRPGEWPLAEGSLRPYQEYGVRWLDYLREYGMGGCLADEMGLGKTIQVIALLRALYAARSSARKVRRGGAKAEAAAPCLVLCPKSVVFNWESEIRRFAPELPLSVHYGAEREFSDIKPDEFAVVLSTYATLRRDVEEFGTIEFMYIILDESQNIKNLASQTAAAVMSLKAKHRLAMSGTPIENNLSDLYSLFRFLNPAFFGSQKQFLSRYLHPIQEANDEDALRDLKARIYPFMLRRLKRDVLRDLPPKTEETAFIELPAEHLAAYHRRRLEYKRLIEGIVASGEYNKQAFFIFKALSELRRLASAPESGGDYAGISEKRRYLTDVVAELAENGHKCLIFTNFLANVDNVSGDLTARGIENITMTGSTSDRQTLVHRFQTNPDVKAFIMTLKTGGTGLNLTAAEYIFIMDPWWNAAAEMQAIDRAHRIGQENPVFCYRLIARDTIEERILELQKRKADLAESLLSDDTGSLKALSAEDIAYLVGDE
ncbi:MAG: DEAD/DEAH box helicase [Spirochaetaceae bacterium]|jgi:SNF2 family DNA or RNA helicase|nr:DEAD/DEAH box helicase [Spirochaetaceae bacterium]